MPFTAKCDGSGVPGTNVWKVDVDTPIGWPNGVSWKLWNTWLKWHQANNLAKYGNTHNKHKKQH